MRKGVHGIVLENRNLLVVRKKDTYILPGGKYNFEGESDSEVLKREFREELSGTQIMVDLYYKPFSGISPHKKTSFTSKVYFCYPLDKVGEPSKEIIDKLYVNSTDLNKRNFSDITKKIILSLIDDNLID